MRVIHIVPRFTPAIGGVEKHVARLSVWMASQDHEVTVIAPDHLGDLPGESSINGVSVRRYPGLRSRYRVLFWFVKNIPLLLQADVVHVHNSSFLLSLPLRWLYRKRLVLTMHGWGGIFPIPDYQVDNAKRARAEARQVIAIGDYVGKWHQVEPDLVLYGAAEVCAENPPESTGFGICMVGRLAEDAGVRDFVEGIIRCRQVLPEQPILICGDGPLQNWVERRFIDSGIDARLLGFVENPERHMAEAEIVLTSGYLGILEALCLGRRVIAVADNPVKLDYIELSPFAAHVGVAQGPDEVADQLSDLLVGHQVRMEMPAELRKEFSWSRIGQRVLDVYDNLER